MVFTFFILILSVFFFTFDECTTMTMDAQLKYFSIHAAVFIVLVIILITGVMIGLRVYTHHNDVITVPDVISLMPGEGASYLQKKGLRYKVVDSVYVRSKVKGSILEQKPAPGSKVKANRFIFLTINARADETINLPDVKDFSQRQAVAVLEAMDIKVLSIDYVPSEYQDLVLAVQFQGKTIPSGYKLVRGSGVTLTVGLGTTEGLLSTPDLHGMTVSQVIDLLHSNSLNLGTIHHDVTPKNSEDATRYKVYRQNPLAGSDVMMGKKIELWMTTDEDLLNSTADDKSDGLYIE